MTMTSIGDLARTFLLTRRNGALKEEMTTLTEELATGRVKDVSRHLSGEFSYLSSLEASRKTVAAYASATSEAAVLAEGMQSAIAKVQTDLDVMLSDAITAAGAPSDLVHTGIANAAQHRFTSIVSALNGTAAGRGLFAGAASDSLAVAPAETMLNALRAETASATTATEFATLIDAWFAPGGGFDSVGYQGANTPLGAIRLGHNETLTLDVKANDSRLRATLAAAATLALSGPASNALARDEIENLILSTTQTMAAANDGLTSLRSELGFAEARIEDHKTRLAAESTSLDYARGTLLSIDPYEHASRLEQAEFQLESLYALTVRLSRLSLVEYLK